MRAKYVYLRLENLLLMRIYAIDTPRETTTMPNFCALSVLCAFALLMGDRIVEPCYCMLCTPSCYSLVGGGEER